MEILIAVAVVATLGLICAILLVIAARFLSVKENEKIPAIRACLPGANCGACGYAGCDGYAKALAEDEDGSVKTNLCVPGADAVSQKISDLLGREFEDVVEQVALVGCNGNCEATKNRFEYRGVKTCAAANMYYSGASTCNYGCIGLGDCARACPHGAICIDSGVARVDSRVCVGCGICAKTCPHGIIRMVADIQKVIVVCSSHDKGAVTRKFCTNGCIGCGKCAKNCPEGAITVVGNLATIDYDKCKGCLACVGVCPVHCIVDADITGAHKVKIPK